MPEKTKHGVVCVEWKRENTALHSSSKSLFADGACCDTWLVSCMDWHSWTVAVSHCERKTLDGLGPD